MSDEKTSTNKYTEKFNKYLNRLAKLKKTMKIL